MFFRLVAGIRIFLATLFSFTDRSCFKSEKISEKTSVCLEASFIFCEHISGYSMKHVLGNARIDSSNIFCFFCRLRIIYIILVFKHFVLFVHLPPTKLLCLKLFLYYVFCLIFIICLLAHQHYEFFSEIRVKGEIYRRMNF